MIALLFSWIIMMAVFYTFGRGFIQLYSLFTKQEDFSSAFDTILIGMCVTASIIAIASIWLPADTMFLFVLIFTTMLYWFCNSKSIPTLANKFLDFLGEQPKLHLVLYGVVIVAIAMFCTLHPMMTDTLYYHYQNIMWNEQYHAVPGLANLQPRFAFNSSYFLLASTFGLKPLFNQYIFGIHTFFLAAIYVWILYKILHAKELVKSIIGVLLLTCLFVIYKIHITSITTDFMPNLLIAYLIIKVIFDRDTINKNPILYFILPIFIITLKLSCFAIAILPLYVLWTQIKSKEFKRMVVLILGALFIIVPWCARNVILSGYLIFPFPYIDLFNYDWKIPIGYAIEQKNFIQSFARFPNNVDIDTVLAMPISQWLPIWWNSDMQYYNPLANRIFSILTVISIPLGVVMVAVKKIRTRNRELLLIWIASVIGITVWFFNAPDFRFIYSLILGQFFIVLLIALETLTANKKRFKIGEQFNFQVVLAIITIIFVTLYSGRWVYHQKGESVTITELIKVPTSIKHTKKSKGLPIDEPFYSINLNGIEIYRMSESDRDVLCFDCDLPCSADYVGGLEMRGKTLQDGFRCKPDAPHRLTY